MSSSVILDLILRDTRFTSPLKNASGISAPSAPAAWRSFPVSRDLRGNRRAAVGRRGAAGIRGSGRASAKLEAVLKSTGYAAASPPTSSSALRQTASASPRSG
jgi:hypothetical protein